MLMRSNVICSSMMFVVGFVENRSTLHSVNLWLSIDYAFGNYENLRKPTMDDIHAH